MHQCYAHARAEALSYILLAVVLLLACYALWSHWYIASLPLDEMHQHGILARGAPALIAALVIPLMLWAIGCGGLGLKNVMRKHWITFALTAVGVSAILASTLQLLLAPGYQWGAQDGFIATVLIVPVVVLGAGIIGCAITAGLARSAGSGKK